MSLHTGLRPHPVPCLQVPSGTTSHRSHREIQNLDNCPGWTEKEKAGRFYMEGKKQQQQHKPIMQCLK